MIERPIETHHIADYILPDHTLRYSLLVGIGCNHLAGHIVRNLNHHIHLALGCYNSSDRTDHSHHIAGSFVQVEKIVLQVGMNLRPVGNCLLAAAVVAGYSGSSVVSAATSSRPGRQDHLPKS